jgi:urease accessory protein
LLHPVFGIDHFLAMLSVGIVSAQLGGRCVLTIPAAFVVAMIAGASTGVEGYDLPFVEAGIASSVIVLSLAIALSKDSRYIYPVFLFVAFFGFLHGYAHGKEMPHASDPVYYAGGFIISTVAIHLLGVAIGHFMILKSASRLLLRIIGFVMSGIGIIILGRLLLEQ